MISVVIPAYNAEDTIIDCVNSVLNQTRSDLIDEIIIVDDGSKDFTVESVKKHISDERVKILSKSNGGVSSARNLGIKKAKSEWIALLDSDDIWKNKKIEKQTRMIERYPEIMFIGTNRNNENVKMGKRIESNLYCLTLRNLLLKTWPHTSTVLINRKVFEEVGLFDENMRYAEDGNMWNKIVLKYPLYYLSECLEIAGGNKRAYGEKGLSSNLRGMHDGSIHNLKVLKCQKAIGKIEYYGWKTLFNIKYLKRIILTKILVKNGGQK